MGSISALDNGGELRIADAGHLARGADGARTDADFHDISAGKNQFFRHIAGDDIAGHDGKVREFFSDFGDKIDEDFGVAVGDINTKIFDRTGGAFHHCFEFLQIAVGNTHGIKSSGFTF